MISWETEGAHREERPVHTDPYTALVVNSLVQLEKARVVHAVGLDLATRGEFQRPHILG